MLEFKEVDDAVVDSQPDLSEEMIAIIKWHAQRVGYTLSQEKPTRRDRLMIALKLDEAGIDPFHLLEIIAGRRVGMREPDLVMLSYAYKCGRLNRREFFRQLGLDQDLLALL